MIRTGLYLCRMNTLLILTLALLITAAILAGYKLSNRAQVTTQATIQRLKVGMSMSEVVDVLGSPAAMNGLYVDEIVRDVWTWNLAQPGGGTRVLSLVFINRRLSAVPDISDAALTVNAHEWLAPLLAGRRRLGDINPAALTAMLEQRLGWEGRQAIDRLAPPRLASPGARREKKHRRE